MAAVVPLIELAAAGDHSAQVELRDVFLTQATLAGSGESQCAAPACDLMLGAEIHARIAAHNPEATGFDQFTLASILLLRSDSCRSVPALETYADAMEDEARGIVAALLDADREFVPSVAWMLSTLADAGNEWAAIALEQLIDALPADEAAAVAATVAEVEREREAKQEA
jgi:hypothetical protein